MSETLNIDEQIAQLDASNEAQESFVKRAEALERMKKTDDYHTVFTEGYIDEEANRVFNLLLSPRVSKEEEKKSYMNQLETIKDFVRFVGDKDYKGTVAILGMNAAKIIDDQNAMKQELLNGKGE